MKRSQINYVIDKATCHCADATAFVARVLPILRWMTGCSGNGITGKEVVDLQLGWDITDFGRGDFSQTGY